jgi:Zn-dependent peptidase ImmA (M78 family)
MCRWNARAVFNFFPFIKRSINDLLNDGDGYAENPKVNIEVLAKNIGIKGIHYVPKEEILAKYPNAHAYIDKEKATIYVRNDDNPEKQRFSIAHEIFHFQFLLLNKDGRALSIVTRRGNKWKKENAGSEEAEGEDIADFFAVNLLIPTERFVLWEDKTNEEIAKAFGVEVRCIEKRREEIEHELVLMTPKNLSSGIRLDKQRPITIN